MKQFPFFRSDNHDKLKHQQRRAYQYRSSWESTHRWLSHDKEKNLMYCAICQSHGKVNTFTKGTNNYKTTTLDRHATSKVHQAALLDKKTQHDMVKSIATALSQKEQLVIKALQTVYYMAKTDVANHKYHETLEWLEYMGIAELSHISSGKNATNMSHHIMEEMQDAIAKVITKKVLWRMKAQSPSWRMRAQTSPSWRMRAQTSPSWWMRAQTSPSWWMRAQTSPSWWMRAQTSPSWRMRAQTSPSWWMRAQTSPSWRMRAQTSPSWRMRAQTSPSWWMRAQTSPSWWMRAQHRHHHLGG